MRSLFRSLHSHTLRLAAVLSIVLAVPLIAATHAYYFTPNSQWSTTAQNARLTAINTAASSGFLDIESGPMPANANAALTGDAVVCSMSLGATAFHTPSAGTMTNNGAISCTASATATATFAILYESNHTTILWEGNVATSSANVIVPSTAISSGITVSLADAALTLTDNAAITGQ